MLINDLSIEIGKNDRICVIGKNGKGKSTLLRLIAGELTPTQGEVVLHPVTKLGYFGQTNIERLNPANTIEKELSNVRPELHVTAIRQTCGAMMFTGDLALKPVSILSGGEKSRVSLGKILLSPTNLLLLDEPTNHLDIESCDSMIAALDEFSGGVVIVTHSEMFLHHLANRLIVFNEQGVFVFEGTYQEFLDKQGWEDETKKSKKNKSSENEYKQEKLSQSDYNKQRKALMTKIAETEAKIEKDEALFEEINARIVNASGKEKGSVLKALQIESHDHQTAVEEGYKTLEQFINKLDLLDKSKPWAAKNY